MRVGVRLFARYREATGRERLEVDIPEGGTVETAWGAVTARYPALSQYRAFTLFAVGNDYVPPDHSLRPGDELCLFPPVSGGSGAGSARMVGGWLQRRHRSPSVTSGPGGRRGRAASTGGERYE